jgi:hypothetical protein
MLFYDPVLGHHEPLGLARRATEEPLWAYDPLRGWHAGHSLRSDSSTFARFFAMLERYASAQE